MCCCQDPQRAHLQRLVMLGTCGGICIALLKCFRALQCFQKRNKTKHTFQIRRWEMKRCHETWTILKWVCYCKRRSAFFYSFLMPPPPKKWRKQFLIDSWALVPVGQTAWARLWFQRTLEAPVSQQGDSFVGSTRFGKPWKWCRVSHLYFNQCSHGILARIPFLANLHNITASLKSIFCWLVFFIDRLLFRKFSWKWT